MADWALTLGSALSSSMGCSGKLESVVGHLVRRHGAVVTAGFLALAEGEDGWRYGVGR